MADHKGFVRPGSTQYFYFDTFDGGTGASITLTGLATTDIEIYKDGSNTTRASDTGYALLGANGIDEFGTGVHGFSVDLASNAAADFFTAGSHYTVVVASVTVDAQTVTFVAGSFTIGFPGAVLNTGITSITDQDTFIIDAGPAEADGLNGSVVWIHDKASAVQGGFAVVTDYLVTSKTVQLLAGPSFTLEAGDNISFFPPSSTRWFGTVPAAMAADGSNLTETGGDGAQLTEAGGDGDHLVEAGGDGDQLTAINLPDQTMAITGDITGNLSGSVGSVTGSVGSNVELGPSEVNTQMVDVMKTDVLTATPQQAPPTTPTFEEALMVLYDALVHKVDVTATLKEFNNNAGTVIWKKPLSDDATDYIEAESVSGP